MLPTIPYDPSLTLGSAIGAEQQAALRALGQRKAALDAAERRVEAASATAAAMRATRLEVSHLGVALRARVDEGLRAALRAVERATDALVGARIAAMGELTGLRAAVGAAGPRYESPVDMGATGVVRRPLMADSLRLTGQYFPRQGPARPPEDARAFVSRAARFLGASRCTDLSDAVHAHIERQACDRLHGTLVLTATCTHRHVVLLEPLVLDPGAAVRLWNRMYPDRPLAARDDRSMLEAAREAPDHEAPGLALCAGATCGSTFVGLIHVFSPNGPEPGALRRLRSPDVGAVRALLAADIGDARCSVVAAGALPAIGAGDRVGGLDMQSMLNAFDDYVQQVRGGADGVPLKFMVRRFSRVDVARVWGDATRAGADRAGGEGEPGEVEPSQPGPP